MTQFGSLFIQLDSVDSTNNYVANLIEQGTCQDGSVIMADYQSKGKGQGANIWQSVSKANLMFSFVYCPKFSTDEQIRSVWYSALMWQQCLLRFGVDAQIKWPNDILIQGLKLGGILIEQQVKDQQITWCVIGCGINVNEAPDLPFTTSLLTQTNQRFKPITVLSEYLDLLNGQQNLLNGDFNYLKSKYEAALWLKGERHRFETSLGLKFEATILGVSDRGKLRLDDGAQILEFDNQQIKFLRD